LLEERKHTTQESTADRELARRAALGEREARTRVNALAQPLIAYQSAKFCKRFCHDNRLRFQCTLPDVAVTMGRDTPLCEWGNASYGWMLDDLTRAERLQRFEGRGGAGLYAYLFQIANSLPFYERWKDWRFGRKVHVPTYIQDLGPDAAAVFFGLRRGEHVAFIAQHLARPEAEVEVLAERIVAELTRRRRLHLLDAPATVSLTGLHDQGEEDEAAQADIVALDLAPEDVDERRRLRAGWKQLNAVEQFVLEAMLIEEQDADDVLAALKRLDIALSDKVPVQQTDRQQLYYFRRKTVAKLAQLSGLVG
jgi:hypothetical protein